MHDYFTEKDWKLFRAKLPAWQEAYMDKLNQEYIELLQAEGNPSNKFWALYKRIREDKRNAGVQCEVRRSEFLYNVANLIGVGAITPDDLAEFSSEFQETVRRIVNSRLEFAAEDRES